jgi:hypothetical protein
MGEWVRAAEVQLETYRWITSPAGWGYVRQWIGAEKAAEPDKGNFYDMLSYAEASKLLTASAIWVSPEMCDIVAAAREGFQPETLEADDFIVHTGFCYFAKPLYMFDRNHRTVSIGAMTWCPVVMQDHPSGAPDTNGISITLYSSTRAEEDDYSDAHARFRALFGTELTPLHLTAVEFGDPLDEGHMLDDKGHYTGADEWWKTVQTTLRLMQQRVAVSHDERLPRATRRRLEREGMGQVEEVLIVRLRRPMTHHNGEIGDTPSEWTHRWIVDGHWRNQWYPSIHKHRQIWISPYVKGPEDKPLVVKRRFYKWDR